MKIICVENAFVDDKLPFAIKPASALLLPHNPFFFPDFTKSITARMGVVVRINKPGRSIAAKFAPQHYDSFAVALDIVASDLLSFCVDKGLPLDLATSFDSSFPVSKFLKMSDMENPFEEISFSWQVDGVEQDNSRISQLKPRFDEAVEAVSQYVTLREGDYIFVPSSKACDIQMGNRVELKMNCQTALRFNVR